MDKATGLLQTIENLTLGLKKYLRFTFILSNNWVVLSFAIVLTTCAMIDEWITQGEVLDSLVFLIPFGFVIAYTITTYFENEE